MHNLMNAQTQIAHVMQKLEQLLPEQINEVEDFVDFLKQKKAANCLSKPEYFDFPVDYIGSWPDNFNLSRQDMYNDDGR